MSRNTLILLVNNAGTTLLAFLLTILLTRGFGKAGLGQYTAVMAWVFPLVIIIDCGMNTLINRDVAQQPRAAAAYLQQAWHWRLGLAVIIIPLGWLGAAVVSNDPIIINALRVGICFAFIEAIFGSYTAVFRAWERMGPIWALNTGYFIAQLVGGVVVISLGGTIVHWLLMMVVADALQLVATWGVWRRLAKGVEPLPTISIALSKARPFLIAGLLAMLQMRLIIYLLDRFVPIDELGLYAAANRFIEAARLVPNALFAALFPRLATLATQPIAFKRLLYLSYIGVTTYALLVALLSILGGKLALKATFGNAFADAAPILILLAWGLIPALLRALLTLRMYAYQQESVVNWLTLMAIVVQLVVGWILVPTYGLAGAAWTMIVGETLLAVSLLGCIEKDFLLSLVGMRRN